MKIITPDIAVVDDGKDSLLSRWIERDKSLTKYDGRIESIFCKLIKRGDTVVDVGANIGDHTVAYADAAGKDGHVYAFEPIPEALECLVFNTKNRPQVQSFPFALSDVSSKVSIFKDYYNLGATQISDNRKQVVQSKTGFLGGLKKFVKTKLRSSKVTTRKLDEFDLPRVDYMKIDVEGYEMKVLRGAINTLKKFKPILVIETGSHISQYGSTLEELNDFLTGLGYSIEQLPLERPDDPSVYDILCTMRK